jgi:hypothetical protein
MSSAIVVIEQGLNFGNSRQSAIDSEGAPDLFYPIVDNRNPAGDYSRGSYYGSEALYTETY